MIDTTVIVAHLIATIAMTGLIWFVQLVHYPLFTYADPTRFESFALAHQQRTTWIVAPLMLTEVGTAIALAVRIGGTPMHAGLVLLAVIWLSTATLQVPCHRRLSSGYDESTARRLVRTNWIRTIAWTGRVPIALLALHAAG